MKPMDSRTGAAGYFLLILLAAALLAPLPLFRWLASPERQEEEISAQKDGTFGASLDDKTFGEWLSAHQKRRGFETFGDFYNILQFLEKARVGKGENERVDIALQILLADAIQNLTAEIREDHEKE